MGKNAAATTLILIPGGPGLSAAYMLPWARSAARKLGARMAVLDYKPFAEPSSLTPARRLEAGLRSVARATRRLAPMGRVILVGHSFGARVVIELLRRTPNAAAAAVLLNCPANFDPSEAFERGKKKLRLSKSIENEADFRRYWRTLLPLYFHRPPSRRSIDLLARGTAWMRTSWLGTEISGTVEKLPASLSTPQLFVNGSQDARFPAANARLLSRTFPDAFHISVSGVGHFPMLEDGRALTAEILAFLNAHKLVDLQRVS